MMNRIAAVALIGTFMASAACAQSAQTDPSKPNSPTQAYGATGRGKPVSRSQFLADAAQRFDAMDANKDGQLTTDERKAHRDRMRSARGVMGPGDVDGPDLDGRDMAGPVGRGGPAVVAMPPPSPPSGVGSGGMLARLDGNGDGKVARAEFDLPFDRLDGNRDGFVDRAELANIPAPGAGLGGSGTGGGGGGQRMMRLDRDGDGKISRAEFGLPFDRLDANSDGVIDQGEAERFRAGPGGRRAGGLRLRREEAQEQPQ